MDSAPPPAKPRFRGSLHQWAFVLSIPAGVALVALARAGEPRVGAAIFAVTMSGLYGISAAYHRGRWSERGRLVMRRLDHSMIFVFIAGSYTPVTLLALRPTWGITFLALAWSGAVESLGLDGLLDRKPAQLSGGQRQRVALARAIVRRPQAFLMDEPLSNLDAKLRVQTRAELVELQRRLSATIVYVTHDQVEAMTMGHRIAVLDAGVLQQIGPPQAVYARPANLFVARFIGSPPMNTVDGHVRRVGESVGVDVP